MVARAKSAARDRGTTARIATAPPSSREKTHAPLLPEFDRLIHERMRLGMVSALAVNESLSFNDLKKLLDTTDGNLSVHARKLEDGGYVVCEKFFEGRVPKTQYRLSSAGQKALTQYLAAMERFVKAARK